MVSYSLTQFMTIAGSVAEICQKQHLTNDQMDRMRIILEPCKPSGEIVMHIGGASPFKPKQHP